MPTPHFSPRGKGLLLFAVIILQCVFHTSAVDLFVSNNNNNGPGSLLQAVIDSNATSGTNTIVFSNIVTGTITLLGELVITTNATIIGPGPQVLTISGNTSNRIFNITGGNVSIGGLDMANGNATDVVDYYGGGILNRGNLVLSNCIVRNCTGPQAGGIANLSSGTLWIFNSVIRNNSDTSGIAIGGGIVNSGNLNLLGCSVISNVCGQSGGVPMARGGGLSNFGVTALTNCTISGNSGGDAAIGNQNNLQVWNSTIAGNFGVGFFGTVTNGPIGNTIIADNGPPTDVFGPFISAGYNLIGRTNFSSGWGMLADQTGTTANPINPDLQPPGSYGGLTPTMPPTSTFSPVVDQGKNSGTATDQRGRARTYDNPSVSNASFGDGTDIGAVEFGSATLLVTNINDSGPGSLRQVIVDASSLEQDTVTFATNVTNVITLTTGPLVISKGLNINGPGANNLAISGNNSSRVFHITHGLFFVSDVTIANGLTANGSGGGILVDAGYLSIYKCQIRNNVATGFAGGGIHAGSNTSVNLAYSSVTHNQATFGGGGISLFDGADAFVYHSTIASNRTTHVYDGILTPQGGGIWLPSGSLELVNSTIAGNHSTYFGGGISAGSFVPGSATVAIRNSIIAGNTAANVAPDAAGAFLSGGYNLIGNPANSTGFTNVTDQVNTNALLGPLGNYGGTTLTVSLQLGSPAIDKGNSFSWPTDQRGFPRPRDEPGIPNAIGGDGADIGALESTPVNGGPTLFIGRDGSNILIAWFPETPGYVLEETTNVISGSWSPAPPGNPTDPIPVSGLRKFYRLRFQ
jgi:hypothetical protein